MEPEESEDNQGSSMPLKTEEEQSNELTELVFFVELLSILIYDELCVHSFSYLAKLNFHSPAKILSHVWGLCLVGKKI